VSIVEIIIIFNLDRPVSCFRSNNPDCDVSDIFLRLADGPSVVLAYLNDLRLPFVKLFRYRFVIDIDEYSIDDGGGDEGCDI
jgi:hypothetical protein